LHPVLGKVCANSKAEIYKSMNTLSYKTISVNKENADKKWMVIDAEGQILGRLASTVAKILRGKHKPSYTPHSDCGDNVIVINAEKIALTGNKMETKYYITHTGYPGGQRFRPVKEQLKRKPIAVVEHAVKGMLPKTKLGAEIFRNLYVYAGPDHKHEAQQPKEISLNTIK
jgi:large subunit ribosomal protein L13